MKSGFWTALCSFELSRVGRLQVKEEGWWIILGDVEQDELYALKRISFGPKTRCSLSFQADPAAARRVTLFLICDSYLGLEQQYSLEVAQQFSPQVQPLYYGPGTLQGTLQSFVSGM